MRENTRRKCSNGVLFARACSLAIVATSPMSMNHLQNVHAPQAPFTNFVTPILEPVAQSALSLSRTYFTNNL
jgi:hypothetical protein